MAAPLSNETSVPNLSTDNSEPGEVEDGEVEEDEYGGSRSVNLYELVEQVGEGTYGQVYFAKNKITGETVALKKVRMDMEKEGFPITAIREIKILKELNHKNVIKLQEIVTNESGDEAYMVFEYMHHDLAGLMISHLKWFSQPQIKCYMLQLMEALHYIHKNNVLHRDIKAANLLVSNDGILKLADFGLARLKYAKVQKYTNRVITLWYRPPELLLGSVQYGPHVDMWSAGCILAELLAKRPIFPGKNEIDQVELIFRLCGTPTEENWPGVESLPCYDMFKPKKVYKSQLREKFADFTPDALDLIEKLLCLDPAKRITAGDALDADYFFVDPKPSDPSKLPKYSSVHEFQTKKRPAKNQPHPANKRPRTEQGRPDVGRGGPPHNNYDGPNSRGYSGAYNNRGPRGNWNYPPRQFANPSNNFQNGTHNRQNHPNSGPNYNRPPNSNYPPRGGYHRGPPPNQGPNRNYPPPGANPQN